LDTLSNEQGHVEDGSWKKANPGSEEEIPVNNLPGYRVAQIKGEAWHSRAGLP
jgi:hypothetical protein